MLTYTVASECAGWGSVTITEEQINPDIGIPSAAAVPVPGYAFVGWRETDNQNAAVTDTLTKPDGGWTNASYYAVFRELAHEVIYYHSHDGRQTYWTR